MFHQLQFKKFIRRITAFAMVLFMAASGVWFADSVSASDIRVYLDGRLLFFPDTQPQMINNRTMVPFRVIGEQMGATVAWNEEVSAWNGGDDMAELMLGDRFVRLTINSTTMVYGYFVGAGAERTELDVRSYALDSPAILVGNRTLVPLRAISEGLGGAAEWYGEERAVRLTSPVPGQGSDSASFVVTGTPWFEIISAGRAQRMYEHDEKFVLVYFSGDASSRMLIPIIQGAARDSGVKVYGVDAREPDADELRFIWNYIDRDELVYPTVFRVLGRGQIGLTVRPNHQQNLENELTFFNRNLLYDPDAPLGAGPTPTPRLNITDTIDMRFRPISLSAANLKMSDGDSFIFVLYRSDRPDSDSYMNFLKQVAIDAETDIFATDALQYNNIETSIWWGNPRGGWLTYPTVYFINNGVVGETLPRPAMDDRSRLVNLFRIH
ncbi:MAG: copper amine oxidase N-terminal domain-containing protein [Defluviitaleaceae bacterium]|nr:copper amine oxidase N-terminal domain-containing protein [Defluviitaleaceae bacterium]